MEMFPNPYIMPNFIDNHDMPRFLSQGSVNDMTQALITMMSVPGIPVIYKGTEQAMSVPGSFIGISSMLETFILRW